MDHELEILKININLTQDLDQMRKDLYLNKQMMNNYKNVEIYRLDLYKNTELRNKKFKINIC